VEEEKVIESKENGSVAPPPPVGQVAPSPHVAPAPPAKSTGVNGPFPAELKGFNWGAFLLTWIWGVGNKSYITLIALAVLAISTISVAGRFTSLITLGLAIWFGFSGNEWAWNNRHFRDISEFKSVQRAWTIAGIIVPLVVVMLGVVGLFVFMSAFSGEGF